MIERLRSAFKSFKPVVLDCYTADPSVFEYAKIDKATKFFPDWWRNIPKDSPTPTMKMCSGFLDLYKKSFVLPLWSDFFVTFKDDGSFTWNYPLDTESSADWHGPHQYPNWVDKSTQHLKLISPWVIHCDEEIYFQMSPVIYSRNNLFDWVGLSGVVEYKYQHTTHVNIFFNLKEKKEFSIEFGEPLLFILPITERKVIIKTHLVSKEEFALKQSIFPKSRNRYLLSKKIKKQQEQKSGCPFKFGSS